MTISPISLAGFYTNSSGQTVSGGISSGLNSQAVITALTASQSAQITQLNDKVTVNNSQGSALTTLQSLLTALQSAATPLTNPDSPSTTTNLFAVRTSNISSNTTQPASNYLTATVASGTATGSYTITNISQLASASNQQTSTTFNSSTASVVAASSSPTAGEFTAGTFTLTGPSGSSAITLSAGDSLTQVAADFNSATSATGIQASVLQTSSGVYTLAFSSTATGASTAFDLSSGGTVTDTNTNPVLGNISFTTAVAGKDAKFDLNNIPIDRSTNSFNDLISGVTINLLQNTTGAPGASFTLQVQPDVDNITQGIDNFATAYNNFLAFYAQQTEVNGDGTPASSAVLDSDSTLQNIYNQVTSEAAGLVAGLSSSVPNSLSAVGLTFTTTPATSTTPVLTNSLSVDNSTLESLLQTNFDGVANVLGYNLTSSSPNLILFQSSSKQTVANFTVNIDQTDSPPTYTATYTDPTTHAPTTVNFDVTPLSTGGVALTGPSGSAIDGLEMIYGNSGNESNISVTTTSGIVDQINNVLASALTPNTGLIANDQSSITTKNQTLQTQITNVTTQEDTLKQQLLQKFSTLEAAINQANSVLSLLNAQQLVNSGSS